MTATDYDFRATRNEVIAQAFRLIGVLPPGGTLSGAQLEEGAFTLNQIVKSLQSEGVFLWQLDKVTLDVSATVASYLIGSSTPLVALDNAFLIQDTIAASTYEVPAAVAGKGAWYDRLIEWFPYIYHPTTGNIATAAYRAATMTIATPCVVTATAHTLYNNAPLAFETTGALPTGLAVDTVYYAEVIDANTFYVRATSGGARINTSGSQSGTHKVALIDWGLVQQFYDGEYICYKLADYQEDVTLYTYADVPSKFYLEYYVLAANGVVQGFRNFPHGLAERYLRQSDATALTALELILANGSYVATDGGEDLKEDTLFSREVAYALQAHIHGERAGITLTTAQKNRRTFLYECCLNHASLWTQPTAVPYFRPFMGAITAHALIDYYTYISADAAIVTSLTALVDYIISSCWIEGPYTRIDGYTMEKSLAYTDRDTGSTDPYDLEPQPDLNMMVAPVFGFVYNKTGIKLYREYGDKLFEGAFPNYSGNTFVSGAYLGTRGATNPVGKQYNQQLFWGDEYFTYAEAPLAVTAPGEQPTSPTPAGQSKHELEIVSYKEYQGLIDKGDAGTPTLISLSGSQDMTVNLWPVPSSNYQLELFGPKRMKDWDEANSYSNFPVKFERALVYQLASDLADLYQISPQRIQLLQSKAMGLFIRARNSESYGDTDKFIKGAY